MAYESLKRTNYDHSGPHTTQDHHQDFNEYHQPFNRMQNSNFFSWGIVKGLNVTGTIGTNQLTINPGVGIDTGGRLISLATGGQGDIGANPQGVPPQNQTVPAPATLTTAGFHGSTVYVTIQFSLVFSKSPTDPYDPGDYEQIPWVRLQDIALFDKAKFDRGESDELILAKATIDGTGNITSIDGRDRRLIETSIGKLTLRKGDPAAGPGAFDIKEKVSIEADGDAGTLSVGARDIAGEIVVRDGSAREVFKIDGSTATLTIGTDGNEGDLLVKDGSDREVLKFDGRSSALYIGANGNEGDIQVKDSAGRTVFNFNAAYAALELGANGNEGDLIVRDNAGAESAKIDGNTGKLYIKRIDPYGHVLDIDARYVRIHGWDLVLDGRSGNNNRALVDHWDDKLVINYDNDYENGVQINNLHLADHIKVGFWEEANEYNPGRYTWQTFYEKDIHLKASKWAMLTMCEIGMYDKGTVAHFWWNTRNESYINNNGNWVVKWQIEYGDNGTDWMPWQRAVSWIAFRK